MDEALAPACPPDAFDAVEDAYRAAVRRYVRGEGSMAEVRAARAALPDDCGPLPSRDATARRDAIALGYRPEDPAHHSPLPWKIVRSEIPYYTWLCNASGGMVANGFKFTDEHLLLASPLLLRACEAVLGHLGADDPLRAVVAAAVAAAKGE